MLRPKEKKWIPYVIALIIFVAVMFIPPKDFRIKDGTLVTYEGGDETVTIPRTVSRIGSRAFDSTVVKTLIVRGNVKKIDEGAFAYSKITTFVFKEGVQNLDENALRNTSPLDIYFPSSLKTGVNLDKRQDERAVYVHIVEGSFIDKYYKDNPPKTKVIVKYDYAERVKNYD